jgi:hypothetical protein
MAVSSFVRSSSFEVAIEHPKVVIAQLAGCALRSTSRDTRSAGGGMATAERSDGSGTADFGAVRSAWWNWPLQQWPWPAVAPQQLSQPINSGWSLVSVNYENSSAPAIERDVLQQHSYGRQIGRLMEAVSALAERLPATARADKRIADFEALAHEVERIKQSARLPRVERLQKELDALRREDPNAYKQLKAKLP